MGQATPIPNLNQQRIHVKTTILSPRHSKGHRSWYHGPNPRLHLTAVLFVDCNIALTMCGNYLNYGGTFRLTNEWKLEEFFQNPFHDPCKICKKHVKYNHQIPVKELTGAIQVSEYGHPFWKRINLQRAAEQRQQEIAAWILARQIIAEGDKDARR